MSRSEPALIPVEEYLNTSYRPDMEYVDGVLVKRNIGDWSHSLTQRNVSFALTVKYRNILALPGVRTKVGPNRYRLPDVCVVLTLPKTKVLLEAPFIAVEILSEKDRFCPTMRRLKEFEANGVPYIWVIDPIERALFSFRSGNLLGMKEDRFTTENPHLELTRDEIFKDLDQADSLT